MITTTRTRRKTGQGIKAPSPPPEQDPRAIPGAFVKTPGGYRAYVSHIDPNNRDRVVIDYALKTMGSDSYLIAMLELVQAAPETRTPATPQQITSAYQQTAAQSAELPPSKNQHPGGIVPWVLVVTELRQHPYKLPKIERFKVLSETVQQVRLEGCKNQWKDKVFCIPNDAAWSEAEQLHIELQDALNDLASCLRKLGHYPQKAKELGAIRYDKKKEEYSLIKGALNPLSPTVIEAHDPDNPQFLNLSNWEIYPRAATRRTIIRHTPQMIRIMIDVGGKEYESPTSQAGYFLCPDDAAWEKYQALHAAAIAASEALKQYLKQLGTYTAASLDGRYKVLLSETAEIDNKPSEPAALLSEVEIARQESASSNPSALAVRDQVIPGFQVGDRIPYQGQDCEVRALDGSYVVLNADIGSRVISYRVKMDKLAPMVIDGELMASAEEEAAALVELETEIAGGIGDCQRGERRIWIAAAQIRDRNLWKLGGHRSFEAYGLARWGWAKSNSHEVASAGEVVLQLQQSGVPEACIPTAISAYRPLKGIAPELRATAIDTALETDGKLTAAALKQAAEQVVAPATPKPSLDDPETWKSQEKLQAAGVEFREVEVPRPDIAPITATEIEEIAQEAAKLIWVKLAHRCDQGVLEKLDTELIEAIRQVMEFELLEEES
jgi:hypothetical protein